MRLSRLSTLIYSAYLIIPGAVGEVYGCEATEAETHLENLWLCD